MNTINQQILQLLADMKAKTGRGNGVDMVNVTIDDAQKLADFVNTTAASTDSGIAAITIVMQNVSGYTPIDSIIASATEYDAFLNQTSAPVTVAAVKATKA